MDHESKKEVEGKFLFHLTRDSASVLAEDVILNGSEKRSSTYKM